MGKIEDMSNKSISTEEMRRRYEFIANNAKEFMTLINSNYVYEAVNDSYCQAHNKKREEFIGESVSSVWGQEVFNSVIKKYLDKCLKGEEVHYKEWFNFSSGERRCFDVAYYPYYNEEGNVTHAVVVTRDITERAKMEARQRQLEVELMKEQRLSYIGLLSSGIAHNVKNPLSIISGYVQLMKAEMPNRKELDNILQQVERIESIINNLMVKSRMEQKLEKCPLDINVLLTTELNFLEADLYFKHTIKREYQFQKTLPLIKGVYSDFSQGLLNIILNAVDAMYESEEKILTIKTYSDDDFIYVEISDTGCGIPETDISNLFTPFYTTKPSYIEEGTKRPKGTGLGLFSTYQILKPYGVKFNVKSEINKGTTFQLKVPI